MALAIGFGPGADAAPVRGATPDLTLVTSTTYDVLPDEGRVAVTVRITATNRLRDTTTRRYFFDQGFLNVLPGTSNFRLASSDGGKPSVKVSSRSASGTLLRLAFGTRLGGGKSMSLTLTFDLVDPGGAPDRPIRISPSLVSFQAWAYATDATPGSSVEVRIPDGYTITPGRGPLTGPTPDAASGRQVLTSGTLSAPLAFVADITADRPGAYVAGRRSTTVAGRTVVLELRAWPDDPGWRERVGDLFLRGLPVLADEIGAPWPFDTTLAIQESLVRGAGGYAGVFDPLRGLAEVSYAAAPGVVLHEAAHGWFNGRLVADRWIAEAFASLYAETTAAALEVPITSPELSAVPPDVALALNAWSGTGTATADEDAYGYAASLAFARQLVAVVGEDALRAVWVAAAAREPAYQPTAGRRETGAEVVDWRALLDLVQANAARSDAPKIDGLWRRWVIRPEDAPLLDARAAARDRYAALVAAAGTWQLPPVIRAAMRAWQFEVADRLIADAEGVLRQRAAIEAAAAEAGLTPPDALRVAFQAAQGLGTPAGEAAAELAALGRLQAAEAARIESPTVIDRIGLLGVDPDSNLASARSAFEAGRLDETLAAAAEAEAAWRAAPDLARGRIISSVLLFVAAALLVGLLLQGWRRRSSARTRSR